MTGLRDNIADTLNARYNDNAGHHVATADAIIALVRKSVNPLVWTQWGNKWDANNPVGGTFTVKIDGHSGFYLYTGEYTKATDFFDTVEDRSTPDDCMEQAFLILRRRILSAMGIDQ